MDERKGCGEVRYHIVTYGCQMNQRDSETIAGFFEEMGFSRASGLNDADVVLYNTCCVRENAENRALGNVIWLKELKAKKPGLKICVCGCMMQEPGMADRVRGMYPFIDLAFGTHNLNELPEMLRRVMREGERVIEVLDIGGEIHEDLPAVRTSKSQAFITIMYGCDNYCSYCIVPYVRGRERSRDMGKILDEAAELLSGGVKEITLLGQNVNSYGGGGAAFAELIYRLDRLGIPRIRFMTSHPKDLSDELIACYGELHSLCGHLHLPVQAGSDRILKLMNRRYTREGYLSLIKKLRRARPEIGLTTDIIVGFPGETYSEFEDTMSLIDEVRYDAAYTFIYSPRVGTRAAAMPDDTPAEEKSRRIQLLIDRQQAITADALSAAVGSHEDVLVEGPSARDPGAVCGKTGRGYMVNFAGGEDITGEIVRVNITSAGRNTLRGERL